MKMNSNEIGHTININQKLSEEFIMLTEEQLSQLSAQLNDWHEKLNARLNENEHFGNEMSLGKDSVSELSSYDNHPGDLGTELYEREKDIALNEHAEQELKNVESALKAIKEGTYGYCDECNKEIPYERLKAIPTTTKCVEHATIFDAEDTWQRVAAYGTSETPSDFRGTVKSNYDEMYAESDESIGSVKEVEGFIITDVLDDEELKDE